MRSLVQAVIVGGYVLAIVLGLGYAWLMAKKPRERKVLFTAAWLSISVALAAAFRFWGEAPVLRYFADITVKSQLAKRPGMRALSSRHPEVRAWLERIALVGPTGAGKSVGICWRSSRSAATIRLTTHSPLPSPPMQTRCRGTSLPTWQLPPTNNS